jgi:transposase
VSKYDYDFKLKVVKSYIKGEGGALSIAKKFNIPAVSVVQRWIKSYEAFGEEGLKRKRKNSTYSIQFKIDVINYMLTTDKSAQDVAIHYGINNPSLIVGWRIKFKKEGVAGLSKMKGRPPLKNKPKKQEKKLTREQELERENELLRAELEFIKKLRALGQNIPERLK